jgi:predicted MPP superfamily phosphohydrolase
VTFLPTTRRKFLGIAAAAGIGAFAADSALIEPNHPRIVRKEIALRRWPSRLDGFTVAHLSDFHYDPSFSVHPLKAAVDIVNRLSPDLIVFTGDFVSVRLLFGSDKEAAAAAEPCATLLGQMDAPHGLWAIMGNHDILTDRHRVTSALRSQGIQVLVNQSFPIESNGARFWLAGADDVLFGKPDLSATLHDPPADEASILLIHEPDCADRVARLPVDLQLSGHSHGGQVRAPFLPPLWVPPLARKYVWGLYKVGGLALYTNPGLGTVGLPVRWNCPPEITLLTLRRSAAQ